MESMLSEALKKLRQAERRLKALNQELQNLETVKQGYLQEIMKGGQRSIEVKKTDQTIKEKGFAISKAKEQVGNLRAKLEAQLLEFRKELIKEKQTELDHYMERRRQFLKRIEELEVEKSRYRYLITGEKDHRLANKKNLFPLEMQDQKDFVPIDETIGRLQMEVSRINRMRSEALLESYLAREKGGNQKQ